MPIDILPATASDAERLTPIGELVFKDDALNRAILDYDRATPEQAAEARAWRVDCVRHRMKGEGKHYFKAVDSETGAIAGYAGAYEAEAAKSARISGTKEEQLKKPEIFNGAFAEKLEKVMEEAQKRIVGENADVWYIGTMVVHPEYQGKGIGMRLMAAILERSDAAGKDVYLESSPAGKKLYLKSGFENRGSVAVADDFDMTAMFRRAKIQGQ